VVAAFLDHAGTALPSHNCQSIASVVARLTTDAPLWSWRPVALRSTAQLAHAALVGAILAAVAFALYRVRRESSYAAMLLGASLVLCATLLVLPVYWTHYGAWLLPVAVAAAGAGRQRPRAGVLATVVVAMLLVDVPIPPRSIIEAAGGDLWFRLAISHQAAGTLLLLAVCAWRLARFDYDGGGVASRHSSRTATSAMASPAVSPRISATTAPVAPWRAPSSPIAAAVTARPPATLRACAGWRSAAVSIVRGAAPAILRNRKAAPS
jgi:hypothetical protein